MSFDVPEGAMFGFLGRMIGYAGQFIGVDVDLTGRENLILQGQPHGMSANGRARAIR